MKECINCKATLEDDELFCHDCGTKQITEQPEAQAEEQSVPEGMRCSHCGEAIEKDSLFCPYCGKPQDVEETKSEEPRPEAEEPKREETQTEEPQVKEEQNVKESSKKESPQEETQVEEEPAYEMEEEKRSRFWLWILLALLIAGGAIGYYFLNDSSETMEENVEASDSVTPSPVIDENAPTSALAFLDQFYKGDIGKDDYIRNHVTANVINKLRSDFGYDCPSNDCLATWVFSAYPAGADLDFEEGPIITQTDTESKFKVTFKYSGYNGSQRTFETRTVYLTVTEMGDKYMISDYEVEEGEIADEKDGLLSFEDALRVVEEMVIQNDNFKGFRSPDNVKNIMAKNDYKYAGKYYVDREFLFDVLYYKDCILGKSTGDGCYSNVPQAGGNGTPSFIGIQNGQLYLAPFNKTAFDVFLDQAKEFGATMKENDESTIIYKYLNYDITGFKKGVLQLNYCIIISKEEEAD
jgi:RNA polymerase subunit RPABC4/transcription elongation factor Spt4